jgi:hypothetical protein
MYRTHFINTNACVQARIETGNAYDGLDGVGYSLVADRSQSRFWLEPFGKGPWMAHRVVAPLAKGTALCVASRLALHPSRIPSHTLVLTK